MGLGNATSRVTLGRVVGCGGYFLDMSEPAHERIEVSVDQAKDCFSSRVREEGEADRFGVVRIQRLFGHTLIQEEVAIQNMSGTVEQFLDSQSLTFLGVLATIVIAVGFGFGIVAWWAVLFAALLSLALTIGALRWKPSRRTLVRLSAWTLGQTH